MKVGAWEGQGVIVANLTLACEAPANTSMAGTFDISSDVQLYNALGVAQLLRVNSLYFQLDSNVSLSSCLWENAPAQVTKNLTLTGPGTASSAPPITLDMYGRSGIFKLEAGTVHVTLKQLTLLGLSALQGGTAAVPTTGLQLVPTWMWAFEFPRSLSMRYVQLSWPADLLSSAYATHMCIALHGPATEPAEAMLLRFLCWCQAAALLAC